MIKKHVFKAVVTALFLCSFIQAACATAVRAPDGPWIVKPISAKKGSEPGYCAMKNHYKDGPTLILARDTKGVNAIALDFHKDKFDTGIRYDVKADAGSVTRQIDALAASKQVLLMQIGTDTKFFDEIARKHTATFTAGKNSYGFDLDVSAADALASLKNCSASLQVGMTFAEAVFPLGAAHAQTVPQVAENIDADIGDKTPAVKAADAVKPADAVNKAAVGKIANSKPIANKPVVHNKASIISVRIPEAEQARAEAAEEPSPSQVDTVRDDMKAEIASEILTLRAHSDGPKTEAMPVPAVGKASLENLSLSSAEKSAEVPAKAAEETKVSSSVTPSVTTAASPTSASVPAAVPHTVKQAVQITHVTKHGAHPAGHADDSEGNTPADAAASIEPASGGPSGTGNNDSVLKTLASSQAELASLARTHEETIASLQAKLEEEEKQAQQLQAELDAKGKDLNDTQSVSAHNTEALANAQAEIATIKSAHETELAGLKRDTLQAFAELQAKLDAKEKQAQELEEALQAKEKDLASIQSAKHGVLLAREKEARVARAAAPVNAIDDVQSEITAESLHKPVSRTLGKNMPQNIDMKGLLLSSRVLSSDEIKVSDNGNTLHWSSDGLFGSAQQSTQVPGKSLTDAATDYLRKTASLCKGDFGQKIGQVAIAGKISLLEADITCVDGQNDAAAAVLFVSHQGMVSVITEEGTIDQLHTAMSNRDAIISAATGGKQSDADAVASSN